MNKNLTWNVFIEDFNKKQIVTYNVLNKTIVEEIVNRTLGVNDKDQFAEEVNPYTTIRDVGKASTEFIRSEKRRLGRSVI